MTRTIQQSFNVNSPVTKGCLCFSSSGKKLLLEVFRLVNSTHTFSSSSCTCFQKKRIVDLCSCCHKCINELIFIIRIDYLLTWNDWDSRIYHSTTSSYLIPHRFDSFGWWTNPNDICILDCTSKSCTFRKKTISRMNGISTTGTSSCNNGLNIQISICERFAL